MRILKFTYDICHKEPSLGFIISNSKYVLYSINQISNQEDESILYWSQVGVNVWASRKESIYL